VHKKATDYPKTANHKLKKSLATAIR
jgi:hypothetical protein